MDASTSNQDLLKFSGNNQANNTKRKGSLSAVIDKLKSARHVNDESPPNTPTLPTEQQSHNFDTNMPSASIGQNVTPNKEKPSISLPSNSLQNSSSSSMPSLKNANINNSEYMVKHSTDGIKITINKTRTKDMVSPSSKQNYQHSSGSGSGSHSPKTHTGLKPGVNSGPASKKPQTSHQTSQLDASKDVSSFLKRPINFDSISGNTTSHMNNQLSG